MCMGLRQLVSNRVPRKRLPEDPVARLQYVYDKVLGHVAQDCTVHEVELLLYPWLRAAFPAGPDSIPDPLPTGRAMLSSWPGGSASCCDADVGEAGQLDSSGLSPRRLSLLGPPAPGVPTARASPPRPHRRPHPGSPSRRVRARAAAHPGSRA